MKPEEIAAYIGAAAWLPQIANWAIQKLIRPKLRIIPADFAEISFTNYGPIFNTRMAFLVDNKDLIVNELEISIKHEKGETLDFKWVGLGETIAETTDPSGKKQILSKDQSPIAIKINTQSILERFVRFQNRKFHAEDETTGTILVSQFKFLKQTRPDSYVEETLSSKEMLTLISQRKNWFNWKQGHYTITINAISPQKFKIISNNFSFSLTNAEIDTLRDNIDLIETDLHNTVNSNLEDYKPTQLTWKWINIRLKK